jgi:hypothetical protein
VGLKIAHPSDLAYVASQNFAGREITIRAGGYGFKCTADGLEIDPHIKCGDFAGALATAGIDYSATTQDAGMGYSFTDTLTFRAPGRGLA